MTELGVEDASILEVGGGVGALHIELLQRGAGSALNLELTDVWNAEAEHLAEATEVGDRSRFVVGDLVDDASQLPEADVVLLHRVICCYPDWDKMIGAAAGQARRVIGFTVPRSTWVHRVVLFVGNSFERLRGRSFRAFIHPTDSILERLEREGFTVVNDDHDLVWRTVVLER